MPPTLQDIVNESTGGVSGPQSRPQSMIPVQGPVQPTETPAPFTPTTSSEPAIISSSQGASIVDKTNQQLQELKGTPPEEVDGTQKETGSLAIGMPETPAPTEEKKQEDFVTYIDPNTAAEKTLRGDAITEAARKSLEASGWQVSEESTSRSRNDSTRRIEQERKQAENELNSAIMQLQGSVITDRELRRQTREITRRYQARMRQMEDVNRRREQTLNTLGVRLGSRYTGGAGGVFGGILAEEERQGVARITAIENEMQAAIRSAEKAARDNNYSVFVKLTEKAQEKYDEKQKAFADLKKTQEEQDKLVKEEADLVANQSAVIEQIQAGITNPVEIFAALSGQVPFDTIKELTDTLPTSDTEQFTLGRYDIRYDSTGRVIARGMAGGGGGGEGGVALSIASNGGYVPTGTGGTGAPTIAGLGTTYENSSPSAQFAIERVFNGLNPQLINNVGEHAKWKNSILNYFKNGYTAQQAIDEINGFALFDNANKDLGYVFYNLSAGSDVQPKDLAGLINRDALDDAMALVENKKLEKANGFFAQPDKASGTVKQADTVLSILNDPNFPKDALGAFDGRVFKLTRQVTPQQQVKIQQLQSALDLLNAPIRVEIVGTAATASEMEKITGFQADILDQPEIVQSKVQDLRDSVLRFHNEARSQRGLPQVSRDQLVDNIKRLELYKEMGQAEKEITNSQLSNNDFLSSGFWTGNEPAGQNTDNNKSFFQGI